MANPVIKIFRGPLHVDHVDAYDSGFYQVTITDQEGAKEILHHITPDYDKLNQMLFKGLIRSFEVELDYT